MTSYPIIIVRFVSGACCLLVSGLAAYLFIHSDNYRAIKVSWIAAILLLITIKAESLPFIAGPPASLLFYRNAFAAISLCFVAFLCFIIFWIQLPQERRFPHFDGVVIGFSDAVEGKSVHPFPVVEYHDAVGEKKAFVDRTSEIFLPRHAFYRGEKVSVIDPNGHPRIDESMLARWSTTIFMVGLTLLTTTFSVVCHIRYSAFG
jgi:hypothetical protein